MKQVHAILWMLLLSTALSAQWTQRGLDIDGEAADDQSGYSVSLSSDGSVVAIGAHLNDGTGSIAGHVRVYSWDGLVWTQRGADLDGEAALDRSGVSVSLSSDGSIVAIGAYTNNGGGGQTGHVRIYSWDGLNWTQRGIDLDGEAAFDQSGLAISLSSDGIVLAIGANFNSGSGIQAGHVRVYNWDGLNWTQRGIDLDGEAAGDQSGGSVSLSSDGSILAIGAGRNDGTGMEAGHVRVYNWDGLNWTQRGTDIDGEAAGDISGGSVSLSSDGSILAIGALLNDGTGLNAGHVRVYNWDGTSWTQQGSDIDGEAAGDFFGGSVSLSSNGNILAIGALSNDGTGINAGHVRLYTWDGTTWTQNGSDIDGEAVGDQSGRSNSLSSNGSIVAVGGALNNGAGSAAGHVRVYENVTILSVDLLSWTIQEEQSGARIKWIASGENTGDYYKLDRRTATGEIEIIAHVESLGQEISSYDAFDDELSIGDHYYKLQQYNSNHQLEVEETKFFKRTHGFDMQLISNQPNVYQVSGNEIITSYVLYSIQGQKIHKEEKLNESRLTIDLRHYQINSGSYYLNVTTPNGTTNFTLINTAN